MMNRIVILLSLLFYLFPLVSSTEKNSVHHTCTQPSSEKISADNLPNKDYTLSSAQCLISFSEQTISTSSSRTSQSSKRTSNSDNNPFQYTKSGKLFNGRNIHFLSECIYTKSGEFSPIKFLFFLKKIRI